MTTSATLAYNVIYYFPFSYQRILVYRKHPIKMCVRMNIIPPVVASLEADTEFKVKTEFKEPVVASLEIS